MANGVLMGLDLDEQTRVLERFNDPLARLESVDAKQLRRHARTGVGAIRHLTVGRHDHGHRQLVPHADLEIIGIVRRRDLDDASSERGIHIFVGNDRNLDVGDREQD